MIPFIAFMAGVALTAACFWFDTPRDWMIAFKVERETDRRTAAYRTQIAVMERERFELTRELADAKYREAEAERIAQSLIAQIGPGSVIEIEST